MYNFEFTTDGRILYHQTGEHITEKSIYYHEDGMQLAHFDEDRDLILDAEDQWSMDCEGVDLREAIQEQAFKALQSDGLDPDQWRHFTWENFACYACGLEPYVTTLLEEKSCEDCAGIITREALQANVPWNLDVWTLERTFQRAKICQNCAEKVVDVMREKLDLTGEEDGRRTD